MKSFLKPSFLKLVCPVLLVSYSGLAYSATKVFDLSNYKNDFKVWNNDSVPYMQDRTITVDMASRVNFIDNSLDIGIKNENDKITTGRIESLKTTTDFLGGDGHKGKIEATLAFMCDGQKNINTHACEHVWPGFWLWKGPYGDKSAEIDVAEFQVQSGGYVSHSNHIYTISSTGRRQLLEEPINYPTNTGTITYSLEWKCTEGYSSCDVKFLEDGALRKRQTFYSDSGQSKKVIEGFKKGYQIIFTQHYYSENPKNVNYYDKFNGHSSEMIIKSLSISNAVN